MEPDTAWPWADLTLTRDTQYTKWDSGSSSGTWSRHYSHLPYLTPFDLNGALSVVITETHQQELLHFQSDVPCPMFAAPYGRFLEDALAVAWSSLQIEHHRTH